MNYDLSNHFDEDMIFIEKFDERKIISAIYYDAEQAKTYIKRFNIEGSSNGNRKMEFIPEHPENKLISFSLDYMPNAEVIFDQKKNDKDIPNEVIHLDEFIGVKSYKAKGRRVSNYAVKSIKWLESDPYDVPEIEEEIKDENIAQEEIKNKEEPDQTAIKKKDDDSNTDESKNDILDDDSQMTLEL